METTLLNNNTEPQKDGSKVIYNYYVSIDELIMTANIAINNSLHPEIAPLLLKRNYSVTEMNAAKVLVSTLQMLNEKQKKEYAEQYKATETYNKDWDELRQVYAEQVVLGRIVFKNDLHNYVQLGLQGDRKGSFSGFIQQAKLFYNNALNDQQTMDALAKKGISKIELEDTLALISKVEMEKFDQSKETGEAQQATKERDMAFDTLNEWYSDFKKVALKIFINNPQLAKILGL